MPTKPSIWEYLPQPERDCIPPRDREDRQVWPGYWVYHNRDDSISFGTEEREYFGWLPAEITRAVPESLINTLPPWFATPTAWDERKLTISSGNSFSSRCECPTVAALSDERLAENDSSSVTTHAGRVITMSVSAERTAWQGQRLSYSRTAQRACFDCRRGHAESERRLCGLLPLSFSYLESR
jgi:hypothetical protein